MPDLPDMDRVSENPIPRKTCHSEGGAARNPLTRQSLAPTESTRRASAPAPRAAPAAPSRSLDPPIVGPGLLPRLRRQLDGHAVGDDAHDRHDHRHGGVRQRAEDRINRGELRQASQGVDGRRQQAQPAVLEVPHRVRRGDPHAVRHLLLVRDADGVRLRAGEKEARVVAARLRLGRDPVGHVQQPVAREPQVLPHHHLAHPDDIGQDGAARHLQPVVRARRLAGLRVAGQQDPGLLERLAQRRHHVADRLRRIVHPQARRPLAGRGPVQPVDDGEVAVRSIHHAAGKDPRVRREAAAAVAAQQQHLRRGAAVAHQQHGRGLARQRRREVARAHLVREPRRQRLVRDQEDVRIIRRPAGGGRGGLAGPGRSV